MDTQLGVAAILKALVEIDASVAEKIDGPAPDHEPQAPAESLTHFTNDALIAELLSRRRVTSVLVEYGK